MTGLMEQIKHENKRYYDTSKFDLQATQTLASNIAHYFIQTGKLLVGEFLELQPLMQSEDIESVRLSIYIMETKSSINFTTME
jgi:hypothetical protein